MWTRFGTPTLRAESGTEEEYKKALARYNADKSSVRIMFYFKEALLSPKDVDGAQLDKVKAFRERVGNDGVLYRSFANSSKFEVAVRENLRQQFMDLKSPTVTTPDEIDDVTGSKVGLEIEEDSEELGYIDYLDEADELFTEANAITGRLSVAMDRVGSEIKERGEEMNAANTKESGPLTRQKTRALIGRAADDMNAFAEEVKHDLPKLRIKLLGALTAVREGTRLVPEGSAKAVTLKKSLADLERLDGSFGGAIDGTTGFLGAAQK